MLSLAAMCYLGMLFLYVPKGCLYPGTWAHGPVKCPIYPNV